MLLKRIQEKAPRAQPIKRMILGGDCGRVTLIMANSSGLSHRRINGTVYRTEVWGLQSSSVIGFTLLTAAARDFELPQ